MSDECLVQRCPMFLDPKNPIVIEIGFGTKEGRPPSVHFVSRTEEATIWMPDPPVALHQLHSKANPEGLKYPALRSSRVMLTLPREDRLSD